MLAVPAEESATTEATTEATTVTRLVIRDEARAVRRAWTAAFSAVGVAWAADPATGPVSVAVRARQAGGWTAWQQAEPAEPSRDAAGEGVRDGAELIWFGPSQGVEVVVTTVSGAPPRNIVAHLINPGDRREDSAEVARPGIARRVDWGADEKKMTWKPEYVSVVKAVTLHHTATSNTYAAADVPKILRSIYQYQAVSRGWGDIGYHVLVDRFGRLWEGRYGGLDRPVIGAHAGGFNRETAGIAVIGNHDSVAVPTEVVEAAAHYIAWKLSLGKVPDPRGNTQLTGGGSTSRYKPGTTITVPRIFPHQLTNRTECPGQRGTDVLGALREQAYRLMNPGQPGTNGDQPVPMR